MCVSEIETETGGRRGRARGGGGGGGDGGLTSQVMVNITFLWQVNVYLFTKLLQTTVTTMTVTTRRTVTT